MPHDVGDRTALVDSTRAPPRRRGGVGWALFAITLIGGGLGGWILWERGRLAASEADDARLQLDDATARAAAAEGQVMAMTADALRPDAPAAVAPDLAKVSETIYASLDRSAGEVRIDEAAHHVVVTLDDPDLFRTDDADLTRRGQAVIDAFAAGVLKTGDQTLWIHGHVDDAPLPDDGTFESAWELSSARALTVLHRLALDGLDTRRLAAVAFGAERPAGADRAKNRRIEIIVEPLAAPPPASARTSSARSR